MKSLGCGCRGYRDHSRVTAIDDVSKVSTRSTITIYRTRIREKVCEVSTHNSRDEREKSSLNACSDFVETAEGNLPPPDF